MSILMNAVCDSMVSKSVYDELKTKMEVDQKDLAEVKVINISLGKQVAAKKTEINEIVNGIRAVISKY